MRIEDVAAVVVPRVDGLPEDVVLLGGVVRRTGPRGRRGGRGGPAAARSRAWRLGTGRRRRRGGGRGWRWRRRAGPGAPATLRSGSRGARAGTPPRRPRRRGDRGTLLRPRGSAAAHKPRQGTAPPVHHRRCCGAAASEKLQERRERSKSGLVRLGRMARC